jgi:tetratricopeptide (TPR) repeat protein
MKQYMKTALFCAALFVLLSSCGEDFLYKAPQGSIDSEALANGEGVDLLVINAYATLLSPQHQWGSSIFNWTFGGMYGGDANKGSDNNDQSVLNSMEVYTLLATNSYLNEKWNWVYTGSKRVAQALDLASKADDMDANLKAIRMGELYFIRAVCYFEGVKVFGPTIPYIDEAQHATDNNPKVKNDRNIYPDILADVDKAISNLPDKPDAVGRAYSWAAKALKAKILMQQGEMAQAKSLLQDVIENGVTATGKKYALADDLTDNWGSYRDNTSPESIFEIQFSADGNNNGNQGMSLCYPHNTGAPGGCCGFYQPSYELANSFKVDANGLPFLNNEYRAGKSISEDASQTVDPRLDFTMGRTGIPYKDYGPALDGWIRDKNNGGVFLPKKHVYSQAESDAGLGRGNMSGGWAPGSAMNIQYISVRDAMLLYAECLANDGELSKAMGFVNQIRKRAGLDVNVIRKDDGTPAATYKVSEYPSSHAAFSDKATCIKAVRMERKLELAMEGSRWFDLARWGGDYMAQQLSDYIDYERKFLGKFVGASKLPASKTMFPIPQNQIDMMGNDESGQPYLVQSAVWVTK